MSKIMTKSRVVYVTNMDKLPANCVECLLGERFCNLCSTKQGDKYLKACTKKRHNECPLLVVKGG